MAKGQRGIYITEYEFELIKQGKAALEALTGARLSWGAYLTILSLGSFATSFLAGFKLFCPNCGEKMELKVTKPKPSTQDQQASPSQF
jgi:uncharacterized membrane protein